MSSPVNNNQPQPQAAESSVTDTPKNIESETQTSDSSNEDKLPEIQEGKETVSDNGKEIEGEEEGECGFCLFMKEGGCKESFVSWEKCVEEAEQNEEDIFEKCFEVTSSLRKCMAAHADYYEPILRAEKAAEEEATKELEKEKAAKDLEKQNDSK